MSLKKDKSKAAPDQKDGNNEPTEATKPMSTKDSASETINLSPMILHTRELHLERDRRRKEEQAQQAEPRILDALKTGPLPAHSLARKIRTDIVTTRKGVR